ncbi:MAG: hypothetical protein HY874_02035 [Chloroflexi bacterium]|nr:hypothetical protein [Chloroflexota bacterium]
MTSSASLKRYAGSVAVGGASFACAIVVVVLMFEIVYGTYQLLGARDAAASIRRVLAYSAFMFIVAPPLAILFDLPLLAARRWRTNVLVSCLVAGVLAGLIGNPLVKVISRFNDCELGHAFPYDIAGCD